jgi:hypothetical protein
MGLQKRVPYFHVCTCFITIQPFRIEVEGHALKILLPQKKKDAEQDNPKKPGTRRSQE